MKILIDNGHGAETPGKRSPDGALREYKYAREIAAQVVDALKARGYDAERLVPEETDVPLPERVRRVNGHCRELGSKNVLVVSIHNNAAGGDGKWHTARGFSAYVGLNASAGSKRLADCLWGKAIGLGLKGNRAVPASMYITQNLAICRDTLCPAVLTENLFQDNKQDVSYLLSLEGRKAIVRLHVEGITEYIKSMDK